MPNRLLHLACCLSLGTLLPAADWVDFAPGEDPLGEDAAIDLSVELNEDVAGSGGFIEARDGRFYRSESGEPIRFWGVNGGYRQGSQTLEEARATAHWLAKRGVNAMRWHGPLIYTKEKEVREAGGDARLGDIDPDKLDAAFRLVAANREAGIYTHFSIYFQHWFDPPADFAPLDGYDGKTRPYVVHFYDPEYIEHFRSWWRELLTTENPYTGMTLADDPSVMGIELLNEDSFFFWTFKEDRLPTPQLHQLQRLFGEWAAERYGSIATALEAWGQGVQGDAPDQGRLAFRPLWNMIQDRNERDRDTARFLAQVQRDYYQGMVDFVRDALNFRGVITCSNWHTANASLFGPIERWTYSVGDFIDHHGYYGCWRDGEHAAWSMRDGHRYAHRAATHLEPKDPEASGIAADLPWLAPEWNGMPSSCSETTWTRPNRYRTEAPLMTAAYSALHDMDVIFNFALDGTTWAVKPRFWMQPWTLMAPTQLGQFPATAILYRKGLVEEAEAIVRIRISEEEMFELEGMPLPAEEATDMLRQADVPEGGDVAIADSFDPAVYLVGRVTADIDAEGGEDVMVNVSEHIDHEAKVITSLTGQLRLDYGTGLFTVDAPQAQAVLGDVAAAGGEVALGDLTVTSSMDLIDVVAVSLDDQPLATSRRILVQVMSEEQASGFRAQEQGEGVYRIQSIGRDPWQIRSITGRVALNGPAGTVTALDHNLYRDREVGSSAGFELAPGTLYYLVER